jgi:hypothetical protein
LEGKSITCRFKHVTVPPKAVCWVGDSDVTHLLLSQGWAELADEVTEANYVEALASARSRRQVSGETARREPLPCGAVLAEAATRRSAVQKTTVALDSSLIHQINAGLSEKALRQYLIGGRASVLS